ncbi:MAG: helix-turn-helix domain-containing protein [Clostridium sp.]
MDVKQTGRLIAARRKQKNLTQQELADAIGVSNRAVSKWETGQGMPDISLLEDLSRVLEISIDDLVRGTDISQIALQKPPEDKRDTLLFLAKNEALPSYCRRLALLRQRASFPKRLFLLTVSWGILVLLCIVFIALIILFPVQNLWPFSLLFAIPAALLLLGYQGYRARAWLYRKKRRCPDDPQGVRTYRFTDSGMECVSHSGSQKRTYESLSALFYAQGSLLLCFGQEYILLEESHFLQGSLSDCLDFLQEICPFAQARPINEKKRIRPLIGCACLTASLLPVSLQFCVRFLGPRYRIEYTRDYYAIIITILTLLLLCIGGFLLTPRKIPWKKALSIWVFLILFTVGVIGITPPVSSTSLVTSSSRHSHTLILKTDKETGKTQRFRSLFPMLCMYRDTLPYTVANPVKTQWLTGDICAVTYTSPDDGELHQYVAAYGDRGDGISYDSMLSVLSSAPNWGITDMADSAGWTIKTEGGVISIGDGAQQESFLPEDCIPFGTTALVLCRNGRPVWTLALGEDCQTDGGVLLEGSLIACRASMEQTAPIVFSLTH